MNLEKLEVGMEFKNYKALCEILGETVKGGHSKKSQLKEWERHFSFEKTGQRLIINKIYDNPLNKQESRGRKILEGNLLINKLTDEVKALVINKDILYTHTIYSNDYIDFYCTSCGNESNKTIISFSKNLGKCSKCSLSIGARKIDEYLELNDIEYVREYKFDDLKGSNGGSLRFDFAILENNKLKALIEYDGAFHDKDSILDDSYDYRKNNDDMKNAYCLEKNIPLIRIHHSFDSLEYLTSEIEKLGCNPYRYYQQKELEIKEKIKHHQEIINKLNKELEVLRDN